MHIVLELLVLPLIIMLEILDRLIEKLTSHCYFYKGPDGVWRNQKAAIVEFRRRNNLSK